MGMDLAGYVINAVLVEGRSVKDVCEAHDISRSWLYELIARYCELADGTDVEILNVIDDHSRLLVASRAFVTAKAADVVETFHQGACELGLPASMLTDNGAIFTAESRRGACAIELELLVLGIDYKHSRP